ncbi:nuclease-related domain-containing protein [Streptomyces herbicida]|uniref:nuclease-related domain-containing protein n=1 Tax=Streptomyces herbicida TaxID=3065675 RepID=UPI00292F02AA|nr:nuclease-related domain-containing protein [Streptomyces sp. NEAU-HV9]
MVELTVTRWKRHGHDRLYANLPDGTAAGWADCKTGQITVLLRQYQDAVIVTLQRHLPCLGQAPAPGPKPSHRIPVLPPLSPDDDLAANPPGKALQKRLATETSGLAARLMARLLRRPAPGDSWRKGLAGERRVGAELDRLRRQGWRVLHSIPLPRDVDLDHLLIGPGGVFSINTKHHPKKAVWVGDDAVKVNHGPAEPYARKSRAEAQRVQRVLERYCGIAVPVEPVLVFVGVTDLKVVATQLTVRVYREREVSALAPLTGRLSVDQVEEIYSVARHRQAWLAA